MVRWDRRTLHGNWL